MVLSIRAISAIPGDFFSGWFVSDWWGFISAAGAFRASFGRKIFKVDGQKNGQDWPSELNL